MESNNPKVLDSGQVAWLVPAFFSSVFLLAGLALIRQPGLQNDELFFTGPIFDPETSAYSIAAGSVKIPVMVTSYTGALKTWLYAGLFQLFQPDVWSVRVPVLLMGASTIWLTWVWVRRIAGARAAIIATALLASDTLFLLTDVFDWGPVAIQHLLFMGGLVAVTRWVSTKPPRGLALGFFLWGLGMWDKALLSWPLIGLSVACFLVWPGAVLRKARLRPVLAACAAFFFGMLPLVLYNLERHGQTLTANASLTAADLPHRLEVLRQTINGSSLFGYMVQPESPPDRPIPRSRTARFATAVSRVFGAHRTNWMVPAGIAGLLCLIALWRTPLQRLLLFLLIAIGVTWLEMALIKGAGVGAHHVILLWPLPPVFLGIAFGGIADRLPRFGPPVVAVAVTFLVLGNFLTTNEYLRELVMNGAAGVWTDAIYPLSDSLDEKNPGWIGLVDWGYIQALRMLHDGHLRLFEVDPDADAAEMKRAVGSPDFLFIQHTEDKEVIAGINFRFRKAAERQGYIEHFEWTVSDSKGRPVFEVFRFQPSH